MLKKYLTPLFLASVILTVFIACGNDQRSKAFKDLGNSDSKNKTEVNGIKGVAIGSQVWSIKNLEVAKFRNGEEIFHAITEEQWETAGAEGVAAWCEYNNDSTEGTKYGKLYNWYAVNDPRGLAPEGWHIPTTEEWNTLSEFLGGDDVAGIKLKADTGWADKGSGNNLSGFNAMPGGYRYFGGVYFNAGQDGGWWTASESGEGYAMLRYLYSIHTNIFTNRLNCKLGMSVRCIKD